MGRELYHDIKRLGGVMVGVERNPKFRWSYSLLTMTRRDAEKAGRKIHERLPRKLKLKLFGRRN